MSDLGYPSTVAGYGSDLEDFPCMSLPLLEDLHPAIRVFGRRGETYLRQLAAIRAILDAEFDNPSIEPVPLLADMDDFISNHSADRYPYFPTLIQTLKTEHRPRHPFQFIMPRTMSSYPLPADIAAALLDIIYHRCFQLNDRHRWTDIVDFMQAFTFHSLNRDLLTTYRSIHAHDRAYVKYCERWGVPA